MCFFPQWLFEDFWKLMVVYKLLVVHYQLLVIVHAVTRICSSAQWFIATVVIAGRSSAVWAVDEDGLVTLAPWTWPKPLGHWMQLPGSELWLDRHYGPGSRSLTSMEWTREKNKVTKPGLGRWSTDFTAKNIGDQCWSSWSAVGHHWNYSIIIKHQWSQPTVLVLDHRRHKYQPSLCCHQTFTNVECHQPTSIHINPYQASAITMNCKLQWYQGLSQQPGYDLPSRAANPVCVANICGNCHCANDDLLRSGYI